MSEALVGSPPEKIYFSRSNSQNKYKTLCSQGIPVITKSLQKSIQESVLGALFIGIRFALKCPKSLRYFSRFRFRSIPLSQGGGGWGCCSRCGDFVGCRCWILDVEDVKNGVNIGDQTGTSASRITLNKLSKHIACWTPTATSSGL